MSLYFIGATLGNDPHTEGLFKAQRIANLACISGHITAPADTLSLLLGAVREYRPSHIGLSYRLSPDKAEAVFTECIHTLEENGLLRRGDGTWCRVAFAALPESIARLRARSNQFPVPVEFFSQELPPLDRAEQVLDYFEVRDFRRDRILALLKEELCPPGIEMLDQMAKEVIAGDKWRSEPGLQKPSAEAVKDLIRRFEESELPCLRTHFGVPEDSIQPTVEGIAALANAGAVDEISLGSSDLSQRYFGEPEAFKGRKNDGGVPYKTVDDLKVLYQATRRGNYPGIKPYAHVRNLCAFADDCLKVGMLQGAHQAVPLFWFNELDGRGPLTLDESLVEHQETVAHLARRGIPVEMNDPNHWASRWAHDTVVVADYGLITAVMEQCGVADMIFQFQLNKPAETGDYADLAKMGAALELVGRLKGNARAWRETRAGIEHFSPDPAEAKYQLARTTLLQMILEPHMIHLVSYCEARHAATVQDIVESAQIVRHAARLFKKHAPDLMKYRNQNEVVERKHYLLKEAEYLLHAIARLHPRYEPGSLQSIASMLADPFILEAAVKHRFMAAPGLVHPDYPYPRLVTRPSRHGFFDVYEEEGVQILKEAERLSLQQ
ncbi:MAG TPA: hypothetical protein PKN92_02000 [Candidatus Hydrogenedentes bacterium]|nr:hypothetical protein [Candidatus Hydrogenedentota bacterium]